MNSTRSFPTVFNSRSRMCVLRHVNAMTWENYFFRSKIQAFSLLGYDSDIRVVFLFTDIGSSWFEGFILDYAFLRFVRNIYLSLYWYYICKCSCLLSFRDTAKPISGQQALSFLNSRNGFVREAVRFKQTQGGDF